MVTVVEQIAKSKYGSRKFIIACTELGIVSLMGGWGCYLAEASNEVAVVIGAWGVISGAILKMYSDANIRDFGEAL